MAILKDNSTAGGSIILTQDDVDDIPLTGVTTAPVSSNWAFDHVAAADPHPGYLTPTEGDAAYQPLSSNLTFDNVAELIASQWSFSAGIKTDTISEYTIDAGILVDADVTIYNADTTSARLDFFRDKAILSGEGVGAINFSGKNSTATQVFPVQLGVLATENWVGTDYKGRLVFNIYDGTALSTTASITDVGVGIGIDSPTVNLHIKDTVNDPAITLEDADIKWTMDVNAASNRLQFTNVTGGTTPLKIDDGAVDNLMKLGIDTDSGLVELNGAIKATVPDSKWNVFDGYRHNNTFAGSAVNVSLNRTRGTSTVPTDVVSGDAISRIVNYGYVNGGYADVGSFVFSTPTVGATTLSGQFELNLNDASGVDQTRLLIAETGITTLIDYFRFDAWALEIGINGSGETSNGNGVLLYTDATDSKHSGMWRDVGVNGNTTFWGQGNGYARLTADAQGANEAYISVDPVTGVVDTSGKLLLGEGGTTGLEAIGWSQLNSYANYTNWIVANVGTSPGTRIVLTIEGAISTYSACSFEGQIINNESNWGSAIPRKCTFRGSILFDGSETCSIEQDSATDHDGLVFQIWKETSTKYHLVLTCTVTHQTVSVQYNITSIPNSAVITQGDPDVIINQATLDTWTSKVAAPKYYAYFGDAITIGTNTIYGPLHIVDDGNYGYLYDNPVDNSGIWIGGKGTAQGVAWIEGWHTTEAGVAQGVNDLTLDAGPTNQLYLKNNNTGNGYVGIHNNDPTQTLDVVGGIRARKATGLEEGNVSLVPGSTSNVTGYIEWRKGGASNTRLGYMGWSNTDVKLWLENSADFVVEGGDVTIGDTTTLSDRKLQVLADDLYTASIELMGSSQGTGKVFVGQASGYGGGIIYNGDDNPDLPFTTDTIAFYRKTSTGEYEVFRYSHDNNNVVFNGTVTASSGFVGNASTATSAAKLTTARTITMAGDTTGSQTFDGSANITITTNVTDSEKLGGASASTAASVNTIVKRTANGYIYCNYLNTTSGATTTAPSHIMVETGNDSFLRQQTPENFRINVLDVYYPRIAQNESITGLWQFTNTGSTKFTGPISRATASGGYFVGSHNILNSATHTNPIFTIGTSYQPNETSFGNMYGVGYTSGSATALLNSTGLGSTPTTGNWGLYVAAAGVARIFLDGNDGVIYSKTSVKSAAYEFHDANNTQIGNAAGINTVGGTANIAVGYLAFNAAATFSGSYNIGMGASTLDDMTSGSFNIAIGDGSGRNITSGGGNVGVGSNAVQRVTTTIGNVGIGFAAAYNVGGEYNIGIGYSGLYSGSTSSGNNNVGIGYYTGNVLTTGHNNILIGKEVGQSLTTGYQNQMFGATAGKSLTVGFYNAVIGNRALYLGTACEQNVAIGYEAAYTCSNSHNVAIGFKAMRGTAETTDANVNNVCIGNQSGRDLDEASGNTFVGTIAGLSTTSGSYNVMIGYNAQPRVGGGTDGNSIAIGYNAVGKGANTMVLGNSSFGSTSLYCYDTGISSPSDVRDKFGVTPATIGMEFLSKVEVINYFLDPRARYDDGISDGSKRDKKMTHGVKAQQIEEVCDELDIEFAGLNIQEDGYYMAYTQFIMPLINAVKELNLRIKELENG